MLTERTKPQTATLDSTEPVSLAAPEFEGHSSLGLLPAISVLCAVGFALVAAAFYGSRRQLPGAEALFWIGMAVLVLPIIVRLLAVSPSRAERAGLLAVLSIGVYLVKVAYSPVAFTFPDELAHEYNALRVLATGHLFEPNAVLPITSVYPGLASLTAVLASATGLSAFHSGLLLVGVARVLLLLTLFLLVERLTHSARVAGLAAALYTANPDYLFFTAQYAYESLALPLSLVVLLAIIRREHSDTRAVRYVWTVLAILLVLCVVITHHVTSYALLATLWSMVILSRVRRLRAVPAPWDLAVITTLAVGAWFVSVASSTWLYLSFPIGSALLGLVNLLTRQQGPRQLFDTTSTLGATPIWQELFAFGSILLIVVGLPFGLIRLWRTSRHQSLAMVLGAAGALYIPVQLLRLSTASWETANRASEFLFLGVAFVLSEALLVHLWRSRWPAWLTRTGLPLYVSVIFVGGVVISWRPDLRLPRAYITQVGGREVQPEGVAVAQFTRQRLGINNSIPTDESNALLLAVYGQQTPWLGLANGIRRTLAAPSVDSGARATLTLLGAQYVLLDRRVQSADHLVGIYPLPGPQAPDPGQLIDPAAFAKFNAEPDADRVADSGNIVVYDVSKLSGVK
jgi:hypothetical protein